MTAKWIRCPNCGDRIIKDDITLHLQSGTKFADPESGRQMSKAGGYKETVFCGLCRGPLKTQALLDGAFDDPDASWAYVPAWPAAAALFTIAAGASWWLSLAATLAALSALHFILRARRFTRIRRANDGVKKIPD